MAANAAGRLGVEIEVIFVSRRATAPKMLKKEKGNCGSRGIAAMREGMIYWLAMRRFQSRTRSKQLV